MSVRGLSKAACSHSHILHPFCAGQHLSIRITNLVVLILGGLVGIFLAYKRFFIPMDPSPKPKSKPPTRLPIDGDTPVSRTHHIGPLVLPPPSIPSIALHPVPSTFVNVLKIQSPDELEKVVGVPIRILEQRARPGNETFRGFIKEKDSLLKVITENWAHAEEAQITHTEMAGHIRFIIETAKATKPGQVVVYDYLTNTSNPESKDSPRFSVFFYKKEGKQIDTDIFRQIGEQGESTTEEAIIINSALPGVIIRWTPIRERYIREYGFYSLGMEFKSLLQVLQKRVIQTE
jgi:hypothetical protein